PDWHAGGLHDRLGAAHRQPGCGGGGGTVTSVAAGTGLTGGTITTTGTLNFDTGYGDSRYAPLAAGVTTALRTRAITYLAGLDSGSSSLTPLDSQRQI